MSELSRMAKIKKPKGGKVAPVSEQSKDVPVEIHREGIHSHMPRTRTGVQRSPEVWGNRVFGEGDRKHQNAKPD